MCICLIQFQHNSYPCNTLRTLAYGYMRYKLRVWLKITGVSISIIFHQIDSGEKIVQAGPQPTAVWGYRKILYTCTHTHTHIPFVALTRHFIPLANSWHWPLGSQPAILGLTGSQSPKVLSSHLWMYTLNKRTVQISKNLASDLGWSPNYHCLSLVDRFIAFFFFFLLLLSLFVRYHDLEDVSKPSEKLWLSCHSVGIVHNDLSQRDFFS